MKYYSLNNRENTANFETAVVRSIAPDRGLYFPETIHSLSASFINDLPNLSREEVALEAIKGFIGDEIPREDLENIISKTLSFDFPVVNLEENVSVLELFHGPTLAFKDVGARFMAGSLAYFIKKGNIEKLTILVATSGDTGGAVANGFLGVEGIDVVVLYPKGKVSDLQEKQLTTLGQNITALEVDGTFDDCQEFVKKAFLDQDIAEKRKLTSANSINVARWLPQMFYYFFAYQQVQPMNKKLVVSVPSGNFGNICAGLMAQRLGLPIDHFVAANNENNVVTRYLDSKQYEVKPSVQTISNAMDVGDPSNFVRIFRLFEDNFGTLSEYLSAFSFTDAQTTSAMKEVFDRTGYVLDPHGAVGYLGLRSFMEKYPDYFGIFLETAHPVKFNDIVEKTLEKDVEIPEALRELLKKEKLSNKIQTYEEFKSFLID